MKKNEALLLRLQKRQQLKNVTNENHDRLENK